MRKVSNFFLFYEKKTKKNKIPLLRLFLCRFSVCDMINGLIFISFG